MKTNGKKIILCSSSKVFRKIKRNYSLVNIINRCGEQNDFDERR